jgi:transcriptional regulator with XRE-family HTH domain
MVASMFTAAHQQLASAVVDMRKRAGLNQRELATLLGREHNYVARIETGQRRVDLVELIQICRACGTDPAKEIATLVSNFSESVPRQRARSKPRKT